MSQYHIKSKGTIFMMVIATAMCIIFSTFTPIAHSQITNNLVLPTVNTYGNAWNGELAFSLQGPNKEGYLVVMSTNGTLLNMQESSEYQAVYNIANNTLLFMGDHVGGANTAPNDATGIWNLATNTTENFPNVISNHDIQYDPVNNTFLTLQDYLMTVGNNSILYDKIVQVDPSGNVLWTWDTANYIPLSEASPFNETSTLNGQTVQDFTHANTLDWDYNNSIIYLNIRNTNTFYKINQTTGDIIWACGEFGNFTLLGADGTPVTNLWYHSHDLKEVAPDVFTMFDNDYDNNTNPNDAHSTLTEVTLNETSMTAYFDWSWEAPTQYWTTYGGATVILPNGDILGDFGDPTHQFPQNQPWNFNNTGAVFVEVTPAGQVVRTFTFPVGWYSYRVEALTDVTPPFSSSTQTSSNASSTLVSPTPTSSAPSNIASPLPTVAITTAVVTIIVIIALAITIFKIKTRVAHKPIETRNS